MIEIANWAWPQWFMVTLLALRSLFIMAKHGNEKLVEVGVRKGQPERYNGFEALIFLIVWGVLLVAGGFLA